MNKSWIVVVVLALITVFVFAQLDYQPPELTVLSVDRIWLRQRGAGGSGEEMKAGYWRVLATTKQDTNLQFLKLNETLMKESGIDPSDFPADVAVTGEIYVEVYQLAEPYWEIPMEHIDTVTVTPQTWAAQYTYDGVDSHIDKISDVYEDPVKVSLWRLKLSQKKVVIPFLVQASKMQGENTGRLLTDHPQAIDYGPDVGYEFPFSYSDIVAGEYTEKIDFYNPADTEETLQLDILWSIGDIDRYSWHEDFLFITLETGGPVSSTNCFFQSDVYDIRKQLDHTYEDDWSYANYWFGGGNIFQGTAARVYSESSVETQSGELMTFSDGSPCPAIWYVEPLWPNPEYPLVLAEGWGYDWDNPCDIFEYPGWTAGETDHKKRLPETPTVYNERTDLVPRGLSVCDYLASETVSPVTSKKHVPFRRGDPDIWGMGYEGDIPEPYKVYMPTGARSWLFTLDISTELVDTVVVEENHIDVQFTGDAFTVDRAVVDPGDSAHVTAELKNFSPFSGTVSVGISPPENLRFTATITGGDSNLHFVASETKTVTFDILNEGLLTETESGVFTFKVINTEPRVTELTTFTLTFKPGLGLEETKLQIITLDVDTKKPIGGLLVQVWWGVDEHYISGSTTPEGSVTMELNHHDGSVSIRVSDPVNRYETQIKKGVNVQPQSEPNKVTFYMVKKGTPVPEFPWWILVVIGVCAVVVIWVWKKKSGREEAA